MSWRRLLTFWALIETDLHDTYGIDCGDDALLEHRSWRWLRARVLGLLDVPPEVVTYGEMGSLMALSPRTRVGYALNPPKFANAPQADTD